MTTVWIVAGIAIASIVLALAPLWQRRRQMCDMGTVSQQWMAEQRLGGRPR